ncbi:hypothetical protein Drose_33030 [Dactylosporangium roseum]|uniref:Phosphomannomutase n=1 Tax=Dactylosporangium roseum TaxID=47989 RepID=A0ABY5Z620_9ACTN|nr:hypothetical protein [Dactylosporangium roseum]UWZ35864.1 hypothetical protein Drose_33030 [Dactylosporangium roseum]
MIDTLKYEPVELRFGTSGLRGLVTDMTDLECYINTAGFLRFLESETGFSPGPVYIAGDLRQSTPRILRAVRAAIADQGSTPVHWGAIPTPALARHAFAAGVPAVMVTGSHIPADRNGIKFYKQHDEVLKPDERSIAEAVAAVRAAVYATPAETAAFDAAGMLRREEPLPAPSDEAARAYLERFTSLFPARPLAGRKVVVYQHSAVGRDMLTRLLSDLGAEVVPVGRSDVFVPIDSENVTAKDRAYFEGLAAAHPDVFAIVSTDGDSDRPFVVDENGVFHRGDVLGVLVAEWLAADFTAFPVSTSDAVTMRLEEAGGIRYAQTRIGSPYVVAAMQEAAAAGARRPVGWEVNGGFLTGADLTAGAGTLTALPTRDAFLPILVSLVRAAEAGVPVSAMFQALPQRFTQAGLIDNFPSDVGQRMIAALAAGDDNARVLTARHFGAEGGFGTVKATDDTDGVRIFFTSGDVAHIRASNNAPQLRMYSIADSQDRADEIVRLAIEEPDGIFRRLERQFTA